MWPEVILLRWHQFGCSNCINRWFLNLSIINFNNVHLTHSWSKCGIDAQKTDIRKCTGEFDENKSERTWSRYPLRWLGKDFCQLLTSQTCLIGCKSTRSQHYEVDSSCSVQILHHWVWWLPWPWLWLSLSLSLLLPFQNCFAIGDTVTMVTLILGDCRIYHEVTWYNCTWLLIRAQHFEEVEAVSLNCVIF